MTKEKEQSPLRRALEGGRQQQQGADGQGWQDDDAEEQGQQQAEQIGLPEWVSFGIGLTIVLITTALLIYLHVTREDSPPLIVVEPVNAAPGETETMTGMYALPVFVENTGGQTAEDVLVQLTLETGQGEKETVSFTLRFLSPRERQIVTVQFQNDPAGGTLSHVLSFLTP